MLTEACGGEIMKKPSVFEWNKLFKEGRDNMEDDEVTVRPRSQRTDESVEKLRYLTYPDRSILSI
jgi:hypothetical protein